MEKEIKFTRAKVVVLEEGLDGCPEAQRAIRDAFPEAFKDGWKKVTREITIDYSHDIREDGGFCFNYQGSILFWGTIIKRDEKTNYNGLDVKLEKGEIYIKKR